MIKLPCTVYNIKLVQEFIAETRKRISDRTDIVFTEKAKAELEELSLGYDITVSDIEHAILNLSTDNYYRGIDPSGKADYNVCAFCACIGEDDLEIYLKYGLEAEGLQILIFSNQIPKYQMDRPFKN